MVQILPVVKVKSIFNFYKKQKGILIPRIFIIVAIICCYHSTFSQRKVSSAIHDKIAEVAGGKALPAIVKLPAIGICHNSIWVPFFIDIGSEEYKLGRRDKKSGGNGFSNSLIVKGNISYDFVYTGSVDSSFVSNFSQHTECLNMDVLIRRKYPLRIFFSGRQPVSDYAPTHSVYDFGIRFDRQSFSRNIRAKIAQQILESLQTTGKLILAKDSVRILTERAAVLRDWIGSPSTIQKVIQEREKLNTENLPGASYLSANRNRLPANIPQAFMPIKKLQTNCNDILQCISDTLQDVEKHKSGFYADLYSKNKCELDSINRQLQQAGLKYDSLQKMQEKESLRIVSRVFAYGTSDKEVLQIAKENNIDPGKWNKIERFLMNIKTFEVGRTTVNYSQLTAQGVIVRGINIEYKPSIYTAFSTGKIDFGFRDFPIRRITQGNQFLLLGRIGFQKQRGVSLIFSFFNGTLNKGMPIGVQNDSLRADRKIVGCALELTYRGKTDNYISAELAKSTNPVLGESLQGKRIASLWKFSDRSNEGVNISVQKVIKYTGTKFSGFFRQTGRNFQCFNYFIRAIDQSAFQFRVDQDMIKRKVKLTAMIRRNDFTNPYFDRSYSTSAVFKSLVFNIRIPKYPVLNLGYYPVTQYYVINKETVLENICYVLNGSMLFSYNLSGTAMSNTIMYNKYNTKSTDSGNVICKGFNYLFMHSIQLRNVILTGNYTGNVQPDISYYTIDVSVEASLHNRLRAAIGIKYNQVQSGYAYTGAKCSINADARSFGNFRLQYEKCYWPAVSGKLYPVELGRISWSKNF